MKNKKYEEIALQVGGSHYPSVGGDLLERAFDMIIAECIEAVKETPKHCAFTTFDADVVECTVQKSIEQIKNRFTS